jgi:alkylhydroperoxidase/carboxymuconolactone decarboxylase family protein YurZ
MYPANFQNMVDLFPEVMKKHAEFGKALQESGPIGKKNAHLIQLAAAAATRSEGAVHSHVRRAVAARAKPREIYHAIMLCTSTIGFPAVAAAMSWARDEIEKKGGAKSASTGCR